MSTLTDEALGELLDELATSYDVPPHGPAEVLSTLAELPEPVPLVRRRWVQLSAAASVVLAGALVAAVALGGSGTESAGMSAPAAAPNTYGKSDSAGGGSALAGGAPQNPALPVPQALNDRRALNPGAAPEKPATAGVGAPEPDGADSRVVKTGSIALVAKDKQVSHVLTAVEAAAKTYGGYVASSETDEYGETPSGQVTLRVPVTRFEDLVTKIRSLDAKVRTATTSGKDVTAEYADVEAQLRTLRATRERFLTILGQTKTISEILSVQQRVDTVSGQIDRLEGSKKLLASQSDLSTLTVSVSEADDPVVRVTAQRSGLSQAFHDAKDGFVTGVEAIIRHSGRAVLWLLALAVVLVVARSSWRVARRRLV